MLAQCILTSRARPCPNHTMGLKARMLQRHFWDVGAFTSYLGHVCRLLSATLNTGHHSHPQDTTGHKPDVPIPTTAAISPLPRPTYDGGKSQTVPEPTAQGLANSRRALLACVLDRSGGRGCGEEGDSDEGLEWAEKRALCRVKSQVKTGQASSGPEGLGAPYHLFPSAWVI